MKSISIQIHQPNYRFLWLKYVTGFDKSTHCAKCLMGKYSKVIDRSIHFDGGFYKAGIIQGYLEDCDSPYIYLCGVSRLGWVHNLHIAAKPCNGGIIQFSDTTCTVNIIGFKQVPISPVKNADKVFDRLFFTCRNWQFGCKAFPPVIEAPAGSLSIEVKKPAVKPKRIEF